MATPKTTVSDFGAPPLLAQVLSAPMVTDVTDALTTNEKAALRTEARRAHVQALRQKIRDITHELPEALRAARDEARRLREHLPDPDGAEIEPQLPSRRGLRPTTWQVYEFLCVHAEWDSRNSRSARQQIRRNREWMEAAVKADAMGQIRRAVQEAIINAPESCPALRSDLAMVGETAIVRIIGRGAKSTPMLIGLRSTADDIPGPITDAEKAIRRYERALQMLAQRDADQHARIGTYRPPNQPSQIIPADIIDLMDRPASAIRVNGRWIATESDTALGIAFARSQTGGGRNHA